ncbi:SAM-dependent methyltransferase [Amycolatopsis sp. K13G38]|uniref:SAM-dependent methyltransferase n=1 Tax=Amycolatopsis acididurans TaxID=2724524 RepID=A0ABX1JDE0_9PSEU|nr:SAM-dependent methyltransferase [Amycolatopsis acididurans]NKQ57807.1 SAM-dependent methyltransferase [Amycolatopsis acididurans]
MQSQQHQDTATPAGIYDWLLGGHHHTRTDADAAITALKTFPFLCGVARANRDWLQRVVRFLVAGGVRQFLDIGSGYPAAGNVHEIAHEHAPGARVVYVDREPATVQAGRTMLAAAATATCIEGDLRSPDAILNHPEVRELLDFDRPVALLMVSVLPFVPGNATDLVDRYLAHLAPGSYLAVSHATAADDEHVRRQQVAACDRYNADVRGTMTLRTREEIRDLFHRTTLVDPGLVPVADWRPDRAHTPRTHAAGNGIDSSHALAVQLGAVGRVPEPGQEQHGNQR